MPTQTSNTTPGAGFQRSQSRTGSAGGPNTSLPQVNFPPDSRRPCFCCYDQAFLVGNHRYEEGVYCHYLEEEKDTAGNITEIPRDDWILSVYKVLHIVRTDSGNEHSYLVEYRAHGENRLRRAVLSQALLLGRAEEALKALRDKGVSVLYSNRNLVRTYLDIQHLRFNPQTPADFWTSVKSVGWAPLPTRFVLPEEIIGKQDGVWFDGKGDVVQYDKAGKLDQWKSEVAAPCSGNDYLLLALSCAFAGPLLEPLNIPGLGLHYFGDSTTGKSTALAVASSTWGSSKYLLSWRMTVNGLEIQAASRSSTLITLDESHMIEAKALDASVYLLLNGVSKARMNKDASAREVARWRVCVLSSGERSIESHLGVAHIDHKVGQGIRIIDVPVTGKFGLFNQLHGSSNGSVFADKLRDAAAKDYGHAGPLFVTKLIDNLPGVSLQAGLTDILNQIDDKDNPLSDQEKRVARSFALIALAGELAIKWGVLPWTMGCVKAAAIAIFKNWRATQPKSARGKEDAQIRERILDFIQTHGGARFSDIDWTPSINKFGGLSEEPIVRDRAGYWEDFGSGRIYLFTNAGLKEATGDQKLTRALRVLEDAAAFTTPKGTKGERAKARRTPDGSQIKLYHIDPEKLELIP